jgi:hypothetical protein
MRGALTFGVWRGRVYPSFEMGSHKGAAGKRDMRLGLLPMSRPGPPNLKR